MDPAPINEGSWQPEEETDSLPRTRVKQGEAGPLPVLAGSPGSYELAPAPAHQSVAVEAYERAPTLMAGETAGTGGAVRVWSPSRKLLWLAAIGSGGGILLFCVLMVSNMSVFGAQAWMLGWILPMFILSVMGLRRPCYLTTDDRGIGITTARGSRALQWHEIQSAFAQINTGMYFNPDHIILTAPDRVEINLTGYPAATRKELLDLIVARAALQPDPRKRAHYLRAGSPELSSPEAPPSLGLGR